MIYYFNPQYNNICKKRFTIFKKFTILTQNVVIFYLILLF